MTRKVVLGLALIIYRGLERVEVELERLAAVQAPIIAAAYGMQVNVNGAGLYVLRHLASRLRQTQHKHRDPVETPRRATGNSSAAPICDSCRWRSDWAAVSW